MKKVLIGFEIETILNREIFPNSVIRTDNYPQKHKIKGLNGFVSEHDGSLSRTREDSIFYTALNDSVIDGAEIISKPLKTKKAYLKAIENFIKFFSKDGQYELNEVMVFNKTCGLHFHFSIDNYRFYNLGNIDIFIKTRKRFYKLINKSKLPEYVKKNVISQYNRHYAARLRATDSNFKHHGKYSEFNFSSEAHGNGLEWRSPNATYIQTWEQFREFMLIAYECLNHLYKQSARFKESENFLINSIQDNSVTREVIEVQNV